MDYLNSYAKFLTRFLKPSRRMKVVFDCSDGVTGPILRRIMNYESGIEFIILNAKPDGRFPHHGPNPLAAGASSELRHAILKHHAALGVLFDADGDRALFFDNRGEQIPPDMVAALLAPTRGPVMLDVRFGYLAERLLLGRRSLGEGGRGRRIVRTPVGNIFIRKAMRRRKIAFAAEYSGHYYFREFFYAESGILAALKVIGRIGRIGRIRLIRPIRPIPRRSPEINFKTAHPNRLLARVVKKYRHSAAHLDRTDGIRLEFKNPDWWTNLRASNTEPLIRLNLEARDAKTYRTKLREVKKLLH